MSRSTRPFIVFAAFLAVTATETPGPLLSQPLAEFQVNTYTPDYQDFSQVAMEDNGDFVVVWMSGYFQDGYGYGIFGRRFSSSGTALGAEFQVNAFTAYAQTYADVGMDSDGDFVVVWVDEDLYGDGPNVFARRFNSAGAAFGVEFQVNSYTPSAQSLPSVAMDADGDFVVAWHSFAQDGSGFGVFARRFNAAGAGLGVEFQVNSYTPSAQYFAEVAMDADGDFVVVWESTQDGSDAGIFARRFASSGAGLGGELQVNTYTVGPQRAAAAGMDADGDFVIAWQSGSTPNQDVFARRWSSAGTALGVQFRANVLTSQDQYNPAVGMDDDGGFAIVWSSFGQDQGAGLGIFGRRFGSTGASMGGEFQANTYVTGTQYRASVAIGGDGDLVVTWTDVRDGSNTDVFARLVGPLALLDIDGNGTLGPLTDGLLVMRFLFGFSGAALTGGAVGAGCTRCDAAAIEPYIAALGALLDIDGNGALDALTDGLMVLRFLFGFSGPTLVNGALGVGCTRCDADSITAHLLTLV